MNEFGNLLFKLRKEKNWTQTELADKLDVTNQAVSKWETGDSYPETPQLIKLSELFDITVDDLLKGRYAKKSNSAENAEPNTQSQADICKEPKYNKPKSWTAKFALFISLGLFFVFAGVILCIVIGTVFEGNDAIALYGVIGMLVLISFGVFSFVTGGILDSYYYLDIPVAEHKQKTLRFALLIAFGVMLCLFAAALFASTDFFENDKTGLILCLAGGFVLIAAAVIIFTFSGINWSAYTEKLKEQNIILPDMHHKHGEGVSRFSGIVMLTCTAVYLVLGFVFNLWHPGWVIFPLGGIICGILGAIDKFKTD